MAAALRWLMLTRFPICPALRLIPSQLRAAPAPGAGVRALLAMVLALLLRAVSFPLKRIALAGVLPVRMKRHVLVGHFHHS